MTNQMPERIYAYQDSPTKRGWYDFHPREAVTEYIRADLAQNTVTLLRIMVDAINAGQIDSPEIQGEPENGTPNHKWHEEWLYNAEQSLIKSGIVKVSP